MEFVCDDEEVDHPQKREAKSGEPGDSVQHESFYLDRRTFKLKVEPSSWISDLENDSVTF